MTRTVPAAALRVMRDALAEARAAEITDPDTTAQHAASALTAAGWHITAHPPTTRQKAPAMTTTTVARTPGPAPSDVLDSPPAGPGAARLVAYALAGHPTNPHSHLAIDGEVECASGHCLRQLYAPGQPR